MALTSQPRGLDGPILAGFAEALAAPEAVWSLLGAGLPVAAFTRRGRRPALRRQPALTLRAVTAPEDDVAAAAGELVGLAHELGAVALMPLDDASVWLCDRVADATGLPVIGPTGAQSALALDKRRQLALAGDAGLRVPETEVVDAARGRSGAVRLPVVVKPALAAGERGGRLVKGAARVCSSGEDVDRALDACLADGPVLVQPLLRGGGEGLFAIATADGVRHWSAHRRLRMVDPQGSGSSACASAPVDPSLRAAGARMMASAGWRGLFMLELLRDREGTAWFMELNGRTWGSLALARRLGLEYPAWAALDVLGLAPAPDDVAPRVAHSPVVCRHAGREVVHLMSVLRGPRSAPSEDWPSRWGTVRDVARIRRGERWYNWHAGHPLVFLDDTLQTVRRAATRR